MNITPTNYDSTSKKEDSLAIKESIDPSHQKIAFIKLNTSESSDDTKSNNDSVFISDKALTEYTEKPKIEEETKELSTTEQYLKEASKKILSKADAYVAKRKEDLQDSRITPTTSANNIVTNMNILSQTSSLISGGQKGFLNGGGLGGTLSGLGKSEAKATEKDLVEDSSLAEKREAFSKLSRLTKKLGSPSDKKAETSSGDSNSENGKVEKEKGEKVEKEKEKVEKEKGEKVEKEKGEKAEKVGKEKGEKAGKGNEVGKGDEKGHKVGKGNGKGKSNKKTVNVVV